MKRRLILFACAILALAGFAYAMRLRRDMFSPIRPYVFRERTACWESKMFSGKYVVHGFHLKGISVERAHSLLRPGLESKGYSRSSKPVATAWIEYSKGSMSRSFLPDDGVNIGEADASLRNDGVVIGHIRKASAWDEWWIRLTTWGRKAVLTDDDETETKNFFGEYPPSTRTQYPTTTLN